MNIKAIVVDMDGTFLNEKHTYNKTRFLTQYNQLKAQNIRFIVASGRQYLGLLDSFPEIKDEITFVADNGSYIVHKGKTFHIEKMALEDVSLIITELQENNLNNFILSGTNGAYINNHQVRPDFFKTMSLYYRNVTPYQTMDTVKDEILKLTVCTTTDNELKQIQRISQKLGNRFIAVTSGYGFVDLIRPELNKYEAIKILMNTWNLTADQIITFGDSDNDYEMVSSLPYGFAMSNASSRVKKSASYLAPSNREEGVLQVIDDILKGDISHYKQ